MLYHHGNQAYQEAATAAATHARGKLESLIETGRARAGAVLEAVANRLPEDAIVRAPALRFEPGEGPEFTPRGSRAHRAAGFDVNLGDRRFLLHDHALGQACERAGLPWKYVQDLRGSDWGRELVGANLNELFHHQDKARYLVRSVVQGDRREARGFLSDRYRRLDSRPIFEAFATAAQGVGAVPVDGNVLDTKVAIKALLPRVFEPVPNEVMAFGVQLSNSDFGDGALSLRFFMLRLWCTNYATTDEALRQVHLGGQLPSDVSFSERTYQLDTRRSASMISDLMGSELGPDRVNKACELIQAADAAKVESSQVSAFLKKHLGVGDADQVVTAFNSADVENLPPGQTAWRLSNAVSWIAGQTRDEGKRLDLERVAALALPGGGAFHSKN